MLMLLLALHAAGARLPVCRQQLPSAAVTGSVVLGDRDELEFRQGLHAGDAGTTQSMCWRSASRTCTQRTHLSADADGHAVHMHAVCCHCCFSIQFVVYMCVVGCQLFTTAGAVAHGVFVDSSHTASNFGKLRISTSAAHDDVQQMRAAGYLEGFFTAARINDHHHNLKHYFLHQLEAKLEKPMQW